MDYQLISAAAALKRPLTTDDTRFVMLASYESLFGEGPEPQEDLLKDISRYNHTLVLYLLWLHRMPIEAPGR